MSFQTNITCPMCKNNDWTYDNQNNLRCICCEYRLIRTVAYTLENPEQDDRLFKLMENLIKTVQVRY